MVTDNQRREVAARIRELMSECLILPLFVVIVQAINDCLPEEEGAYAFILADLIEPQRKTCRLDLTDTETHGNAKVRIYECSECGRTCEEIYGKYERCPHCGAEVVEDD